MKIKVRSADEGDFLKVVNSEFELARTLGTFSGFSVIRINFVNDVAKDFEDSVMRPWTSCYNFNLAEIVGGVVGYVKSSTSNQVISIDRLYVNKNFRRFGVGRELLHSVLSEARFKCVRKAIVTLGPEEARKFYESLGFRQSDKYGKNELVLKLGSHNF